MSPAEAKRAAVEATQGQVTEVRHDATVEPSHASRLQDTVGNQLLEAGRTDREKDKLAALLATELELEAEGAVVESALGSNERMKREAARTAGPTVIDWGSAGEAAKRRRLNELGAELGAQAMGFEAMPGAEPLLYVRELAPDFALTAQEYRRVKAGGSAQKAAQAKQQRLDELAGQCGAPQVLPQPAPPAQEKPAAPAKQPSAPAIDGSAAAPKAPTASVDKPAPSLAAVRMLADPDLDHYMAVNWDSTDYERLVAETGFNPGTLGPLTGRLLGATGLSEGERQGAELVWSLGAGAVDGAAWALLGSVPVLDMPLRGARDLLELGAFAVSAWNNGGVLSGSIAMMHGLSVGLKYFASSIDSIETLVTETQWAGVASFLTGIGAGVAVGSATVNNGLQAFTALLESTAGVVDMAIAVMALAQGELCQANGERYAEAAFWRQVAFDHLVDTIIDGSMALISLGSIALCGNAPAGAAKRVTERMMDGLVDGFDGAASGGAAGQLGTALGGILDGMQGDIPWPVNEVEGESPVAMAIERARASYEQRRADAFAELEGCPPQWHAALIDEILANPGFWETILQLTDPSSAIAVTAQLLTGLPSDMVTGLIAMGADQLGTHAATVDQLIVPAMADLDTKLTEYEAAADQALEDLAGEIQKNREGLASVRRALAAASGWLASVESAEAQLQEGGAMADDLVERFEDQLIDPGSLDLSPMVPRALVEQVVSPYNEAVLAAQRQVAQLVDGLLGSSVDSVSQQVASARALLDQLQHAAKVGGAVEVELLAIEGRLRAALAELVMAIASWEMPDVPPDAAAFVAILRQAETLARELSQPGLAEFHSYVATHGVAHIAHWKALHAEHVAEVFQPSADEVREAILREVLAVGTPEAQRTAERVASGPTGDGPDGVRVLFAMAEWG